ncbi:hypothetical protein ACTJJ0_03190 [Chitinophaga sp. 22321]|uniref:Uncharacterized protein n=1 Tax=Chitinophaga hostae TaxID=2831022 RepID=A0ABS5JAK2_9BACT|nr:hypothetical protein [Chitinophaga hostae]MBS0032095.1 hypothetical protein [Chitinophaga hostae]
MMLFNEPFTNNFSHVYLNRRIDPAQAENEKKIALDKLNNASYLLQEYCTAIVDQLWRGNEITAEVLQQIKGVNSIWLQHIQKDNSFLTYDCAAYVVRELQAYNYSLREIAGTDEKLQQLEKAFAALSYKTKAFFQVSLFLPFDQLSSSFDTIKELFEQQADLFYYVDTIEISRQDFFADRQQENDGLHFPLIKILLDAEIVLSRHHPVLREVVTLMDQVTKDMPVYQIDDSYMFLAGKNLAVSQGFKNYKRFLKLVNTLDNIYDNESNYAYLK